MESKFGKEPRYGNLLSELKRLFQTTFEFPLDYIKNDYYLQSDRVKMGRFCKTKIIVHDFAWELGLLFFGVLISIMVYILHRISDKFGRIVDSIYSETLSTLKANKKVSFMRFFIGTLGSVISRIIIQKIDRRFSNCWRPREKKSRLFLEFKSKIKCIGFCTNTIF